MANSNKPNALQPSATNASFVGPIYVMPSENAKKCQLFLDKAVQLFVPRDVVEEDWAHQYVHNALLIRRYNREVSLVIERRVQLGQEAQLQRAKEIKRRHEANLADVAKRASDRPEDVALLLQLERRVESAVKDVDAILAAKPDDLAYSRALEKSNEHLEILDRLITSATKHRDEALEFIAMWREGFGKRLRQAQVPGKIVDATLEADDEALPQIPAPSVSPAK